MKEQLPSEAMIGTHECPVCRKPMIWEPAADNGGATAGWMFDCDCLDDEPMDDATRYALGAM